METKLGKITLPPWAQGVIAVTVLAGTIGLGYLGFNYVKKKNEEKESSDVVDDITKEAGGIKAEDLSAPMSSYSATINLIIKLLSGPETFSSELQVIESIIKIVKKPKDWKYLVKKFGTKNIDDVGWGATNYDLITLLKDQLDTSGMYSIDVDGYKRTGFAFNSIDILTAYFKTIGVDF